MSSLKSKEAKSPRGTSGAHLSSPTRVVIIASRVNTPPPEQPKVVPAWPAELGPRPALHIARTGASQGFPRAAAPMGVFSRGTARISGSLSCGAREVRSPCA